MRELGLYLFRPVTATAIQQGVALRQAVAHTFEQRDDMRMVEVGLYLLPEIGHGGERVVATHSPHSVGIGPSEQDFPR